MLGEVEARHCRGDGLEGTAYFRRGGGLGFPQVKMRRAPQEVDQDAVPGRSWRRWCSSAGANGPGARSRQRREQSACSTCQKSPSTGDDVIGGAVGCGGSRNIVRTKGMERDLGATFRRADYTPGRSRFVSRAASPEMAAARKIAGGFRVIFSPA